MPSVSKQQYKFMKAVERGDVKAPGLSPEKAHEFTEGMTSKRWKKLKERVSARSKK